MFHSHLGDIGSHHWDVLELRPIAVQLQVLALAELRNDTEHWRDGVRRDDIRGQLNQFCHMLKVWKTGAVWRIWWTRASVPEVKMLFKERRHLLQTERRSSYYLQLLCWPGFINEAPQHNSNTLIDDTYYCSLQKDKYTRVRSTLVLTAHDGLGPGVMARHSEILVEQMWPAVIISCKRKNN